jgi:hypothetical protein
MTRAALVATALALLVAACGATTPGGAGPTTAPPDTEATAPTLAGGEDDGTDTTDSGDVPAVANGVGVTDTEVSVAFIVTDTTRVASALGLDIPDQGDVEAQIRTLVDHVNATGGLGGRTVVPFIRSFDALVDSPSTEEELCNAITQDDQVFAVIMTGQFQENARPCYSNRQTLMLDWTFYPVDSAGYAAFAPYLWSPALTPYDTLMGGLIDGLSNVAWFDGATLGIIGADNELSRKAFDEVISPKLAGIGVEPAEVQWVDVTDTATLNPAIDQAVLAFKDAGVDHVLTIGGSRIQPFFMQSATAQQYVATYAMTSYDSPDFSILNYPDQVVGSSGISVLPAWDVGDDQHPFPANQAESECLDILAGGGHTFEARNQARSALIYCDGLRLLQAGAADLTNGMDAAAWASAVGALGSGFELATTYQTEFDSGDPTGAAAYVVTGFDATCSCMVLQGGFEEFAG